jgi:hypothetical protein
LANEFNLLMKILEELLFSWQELHVVFYIGSPNGTRSTSRMRRAGESWLV